MMRQQHVTRAPLTELADDTQPALERLTDEPVHGSLVHDASCTRRWTQKPTNR